MPDLVSIAGMALIMAGGLYTMHRHRTVPVRPAAALAEEPREAA